MSWALALTDVSLGLRKSITTRAQHMDVGADDYVSYFLVQDSLVHSIFPLHSGQWSFGSDGIRDTHSPDDLY